MLRSSKSAASAKQAPDDSEKVPNVEDTGSSPIAIDTMFSVREVWKTLEDAGEQLTQASKLSLFFRAVTAGIFIGFGGILTLSVGFDMGSPPWESGNGFARFMSGAIGFPLTILLVSITGQGAWTGDALLVAVAYWRKRCSLACVIRLLIITYIGCFVSTLAMGAFAVGADLPAVKPCQLLAAHKMHLTPLQLLLRGMGGGCLICLSIFLSKSARSMPGKVMAIWFCISTYVICDYEHCLATMFFLSCAVAAGDAITAYDYFRVLLPATVGNLLGGAILVGIGIANVPQKKRKGYGQTKRPRLFSY